LALFAGNYYAIGKWGRRCDGWRLSESGTCNVISNFVGLPELGNANAIASHALGSWSLFSGPTRVLNRIACPFILLLLFSFPAGNCFRTDFATCRLAGLKRPPQRFAFIGAIRGQMLRHRKNGAGDAMVGVCQESGTCNVINNFVGLPEFGNTNANANALPALGSWSLFPGPTRVLKRIACPFILLLLFSFPAGNCFRTDFATCRLAGLKRPPQRFAFIGAIRGQILRHRKMGQAMRWLASVGIWNMQCN
jgi:hypothetical protein